MTDNSSTYSEFYKTSPSPVPRDPIYDTNPRVRFMNVPDGTYVLVIDNWSGLGADDGWAEHLKESTGASGVIVFSCKVDLN